MMMMTTWRVGVCRHFMFTTIDPRAELLQYMHTCPLNLGISHPYLVVVDDDACFYIRILTLLLMVVMPMIMLMMMMIMMI